MSRSRKLKNAPVTAWTTPETDTRKVVSWTALDSELLLHPAVATLGHLAFRTYVMLILASHGKQEFSCPYTTAEKCGITRSSYTKALADLQQAGFIRVASGQANRQASTITFVYEWKSKSPLRKKQKRKQPEQKTAPNHWGRATPTIGAELPHTL